MLTQDTRTPGETAGANTYKGSKWWLQKSIFAPLAKEQDSSEQFSKQMYCRTGEDVNDGFGNLIASCREYTLSRTHPDSEPKLWIYKYTEIGPDLEVKVVCHHSVYGINIQIPSSSGDNTNVWVVISRSSIRSVDELRYRESQNLLGEVAQECIQDQGEERSQGERSDDRHSYS